MIFIVISRWVWSALIGGCGLPLIFVSESWSLWVSHMQVLATALLSVVSHAPDSLGESLVHYSRTVRSGLE